MAGPSIEMRLPSAEHQLPSIASARASPGESAMIVPTAIPSASIHRPRAMPRLLSIAMSAGSIARSGSGAQLLGEQALGEHAVDPLVAVDKLRHPEIDAEAAEHVGVLRRQPRE